MSGNVLARTRAAMVRGLAVVAVVGTCAAGSLGAQVATAVGVSTLALTTSATPADAWWRRGWGFRRGWGWRRPAVWGWRRPVVWGVGPGWGWRRGWGWRGGWGRGWGW